MACASKHSIDLQKLTKFYRELCFLVTYKSDASYPSVSLLVLQTS